jgi:FKBP-type peptidyl-prolyl cis-trans isomerase FklB
MMTRTNWIVLLALSVFGFHANAEQAVVIDAQAIGEPAAATAPEAKAAKHPAAQAGSEISQADANKERVLKAHKLSPRQRTAVAKAKLADSNVQDGETFLATNKDKPGVVSLPSGVQYKIIRAGKGKKPTDTSEVSCRYTGKLIDGTSFESTDAKKPSWLAVSGFVPGLKEAVKLMSNGAKWEIVVPPKLAYGAQGNRGVGPNAVVIYTMEIGGVK